MFVTHCTDISTVMIQHHSHHINIPKPVVTSTETLKCPRQLYLPLRCFEPV